MSFIEKSQPHNARTDESTGLRWYKWQGIEYPSVTSIRRLAGIPWGLHMWAVSRIAERATLGYIQLGEMLTRERRPRERVLEKNRLEEAQTWLRVASVEERDAAARLGTAVHDAAERMADPATVPDDVRPRLVQFYDWLKVSGATILGSEFQCFNLTVGYAGTCDLLVRFANGSVWVVDLKTGSGTYPEHALQCGAYKEAEFVGRDDVVDEQLTTHLHEATAIAVLHLADDHWEFQQLRWDQETWYAFRGLLLFANWTAAHPRVESVVTASRRGSAARRSLRRHHGAAGVLGPGGPRGVRPAVARHPPLRARAHGVPEHGHPAVRGARRRSRRPGVLLPGGRRRRLGRRRAAAADPAGVRHGGRGGGARPRGRARRADAARCRRGAGPRSRRRRS